MSVDSNIVLVGHSLMDIKLGKAIKDNRLSEHVKMSSNRAKEFLNEFNLDKNIQDIIINCVEAHHGAIPFLCKEAEICTNADCYRFLHPRSFFIYLNALLSEDNNINNCLKQIEYKIDEKYNILTLDTCKKELEPYYKEFKKMIKVAKEFK